MGCHSNPMGEIHHFSRWWNCTTKQSKQLKMDNKLGFIPWKMLDFLRSAPIQRDSHMGGKLVILDLPGLAGANLFLGKS